MDGMGGLPDAVVARILAEEQGRLEKRDGKSIEGLPENAEEAFAVVEGKLAECPVSATFIKEGKYVRWDPGRGLRMGEDGQVVPRGWRDVPKLLLGHYRFLLKDLVRVALQEVKDQQRIARAKIAEGKMRGG